MKIRGIEGTKMKKQMAWSDFGRPPPKRVCLVSGHSQEEAVADAADNAAAGRFHGRFHEPTARTEGYLVSDDEADDEVEDEVEDEGLGVSDRVVVTCAVIAHYNFYGGCAQK